jgi:AraC family transcriptional regulator
LTDKEKDIISRLVGEFTDNQIQNLIENLETYINPDLSMFIPIYRYCDYAVSPNHSHPSYSFIYNINQKGSLIVNGEPKTNPKNNNPFICAFSPGVRHQEIIEEGFSNYIAVFIDKNYFNKATIGYGIEVNKDLKGAFLQADENLLYLLKLLMLEYNTKQEKHTQVIDSLITLITNQFIRLICNDKSVSLPINTSNKVDLAIAFMHENIAEKLTVNDISAHVNTSPSHFA